MVCILALSCYYTNPTSPGFLIPHTVAYLVCRSFLLRAALPLPPLASRDRRKSPPTLQQARASFSHSASYEGCYVITQSPHIHTHTSSLSHTHSLSVQPSVDRAEGRFPDCQELRSRTWGDWCILLGRWRERTGGEECVDCTIWSGMCSQTLVSPPLNIHISILGGVRAVSRCPVWELRGWYKYA